MADRKKTPDVLSQVLGGDPSAAPMARPSDAKPESQAKEPQTASGQTTSTRRSGTRRKAQPPRWEYLEVLCRDYGGLRPRFLSGEEQENWKKLPVVHEYLNQLGEEGWELAGVGTWHRDQVPFYLKRRKR
jgi:hypothetical protein